MLFYKNYIVYMLISLEILVSIISPSIVPLHLLASEIANVLPDVAYCCFTRTIKLFTCWFYQLLVSITSPSFVALHLLVSEIANVLHEVVVVLQKTHTLLQCLP